MVENAPEETRPDPLETVKIESFEGIGEVTVGVGSNWHKMIFALVLLDNPNVNRYFLSEQLRLTDRITKTKIFPREGMALPGGEEYVEPLTEDKKEG